MNIAEIDETTEIAEVCEDVYAEIELDVGQFTCDGKLKLQGAIPVGDDDVRFSGKQRSSLLTPSRVGVWYQDYSDYSNQYTLIVEVDTTMISGRITNDITEDEAQALVDNYSDGVWDYVE